MCAECVPVRSRSTGNESLCHCVNTETMAVTLEAAKGHSSVSICITHTCAQACASVVRPVPGQWAVSYRVLMLLLLCWPLVVRLHGTFTNDHIHQNSALTLSFSLHSHTVKLTHIYSETNYVHEYTPYSFTKYSGDSSSTALHMETWHIHICTFNNTTSK